MDQRDRQALYGSPLSWGVEADEERMVLTIHLKESEPLEIPAVYVVCPLCEGRGKHVNPSIDAHGITQEEVERDWDPEEWAGYRQGRCDIPCYRCKGKRVVLAPDEPTLGRTEDGRRILTVLDQLQQEHAAYVQECEAERRMGAW